MLILNDTINTETKAHLKSTFLKFSVALYCHSQLFKPSGGCTDMGGSAQGP